MWRESVPVIVAGICYAVSVGLHIQLEPGEVTLGAAFAPLLVFLGPHAFLPEVGVATLAGALGALSATVRRRSIHEVAFDLPALALCLLSLHAVAGCLSLFGVSTVGPFTMVIAGSVGVIVYSVVADAGQRLVGWRPSVSWKDRRVWFLLQAVLVSAFGLMILVYQQIGWPAVAAMLILLGLTKREFDRYAMARHTLTQTIEALYELEQASLL